MAAMTMPGVTRRRRVLLVTPEPPSPAARGGRPQATAATLRALLDRYEVTLVTQAGGDPADADAIARWERAGVDTRVAWWPRPTGIPLLARRLDLATRWALGGDPWTTVRYADPAVQAALDEVLAGSVLDLIVVEDNVMAGYAYRSPAPKILSEHEVRRHRAPRWRAALTGRGLRGGLEEADWQRWPETHRRAWRRFDRVQLLTPADLAAARALAPDLADRFRLNPIGLELPDTAPAPAAPPSWGDDGARLVFVGAFSHAPNVDAAEWIARDVLPAIRRRRPEARLALVGHSPPPVIRALAGPAVAVTGAVPDVTPYLAAADVVLAPVRIGGGLRTKVLQAMALAKPVITTTRGAEGIEVDPVRPPLVVADTTAAIAQAAIGLLADPVARGELGDRARAHVVAHHSPAANGARLDRIVAELTAVPAARVAGAPAVAAS